MSDVNSGMRVVGIAQAVKNLADMSDAIVNRVTRKSVRAATRVIANQIKSTTYGGGRHRITGLLQRSQAISVSSKGDIITGKVVMRPVDVSGNTKIARLVRRTKSAKINRAGQIAAFYWRFLEKGTATRQTASGANRGAVPAMPWVVPAFDATDNAAVDAFAKMFNSETEREAAQLTK
jgi:HK97 gp10 family phage protein